MASIESQLKNLFKENVLPIFEANAQTTFQKTKEYILTRVSNHGICHELRSKTLPSRFLGSSSSTLFGFMGFDDGDDPVGKLLSYLSANITNKNIVRIASLTLLSSISIPDKDKMRKESSLALPWIEGISWPEAIENGLSGLPYFLGKSGQGRSNLGVQATVRGIPGNPPQKVRSFDAPPIPFLSPIFSAAKKIT